MNNYFVERSPDYLEHHGILGQKWGIRRYQNPDGSLTEAGKERYRLKNKKQASKLKEEYQNMFNWKNRDEKNVDKMFEMTGASKEALEKVKKYSKEYADKIDNIEKEADELFKDFDKETRTFYEASSELAEMSLYHSRDPKESTLEEIGWAGFMGCLEDGQQQSINANSMYANEKGIADQCIKLDEEYSNAFKDYREKAGQVASQAFEEVGANIQIYGTNPNYKLGKEIVDSNGYAIERNHKTDRFYQAIDGGYKYSDSETKAVNEAKEIISRIEGHKDYNTWWYFGEAAQNLGMDQIKAEDMSQSDWDRINAEIRKLRSLNHSAFEDSDYYLEHHGILGQKWGIRRYQNPDGSLTPEGRARYGDILTPDQMKKMIKDYNLRTGSKKKLNKKTVFKTPNGMYDYKGRRMNDNTDVDDPGNKKPDKTKTDTSKKKPSEMTDQELRDVNTRMQLELDYRNKMAQLNPKKVTAGQQLVQNMKDSLIREIPNAISGGIRQYIQNEIGNLAKNGEKDDNKRTNTNINPRTASDSELDAALRRKTKEAQYEKLMHPESGSSGNSSNSPSGSSSSSSSSSSSTSSVASTKTSDISDDYKTRSLFSNGSTNNSTSMFDTNVANKKVDDIDRSEFYNDLWNDMIKHDALKITKNFMELLKELIGHDL